MALMSHHSNWYTHAYLDLECYAVHNTLSSAELINISVFDRQHKPRCDTGSNEDESWQSRDLGQLFLMLSQHYHVFYLSWTKH
jgi:hypothetical protein